MIAESVNTKVLFTSLDTAWDELMELIISTNGGSINAVPFENSWTVTQLATHITKSNKAISQGLNLEGVPAERNPEEGVPNLEKIFLDFDVKYTSPEFIAPEKKNYNKYEVINTLKATIDKLKEMRGKVNLTEIINLPLFGEVTKLELLHFVLYHTQRHVHQLKNIIKSLKRNAQ